MNEITFDMVLQGLNTAALVVFIIFFLRGDILPKSVVDRILKEAENRTTALATVIKKDLKEAVADGFTTAIAKSKGFSITSEPEK